MAATVTIRRWTGTTGAPVKTDITSANTRANAEDSPTSTTLNSVLIPTSGSNYSYWVATRLSVDAITAGTVNNIKWYTDGVNNFGTGVTALAQDATAYVQATGTVGTTGLALNTTNYASLTGAPVDPFTFTSGSPKTVTGTLSATGDLGNFMVYQLVVGTTAASGASAQETFTWQYDDTSS